MSPRWPRPRRTRVVSVAATPISSSSSRSTSSSTGSSDCATPAEHARGFGSTGQPGSLGSSGPPQDAKPSKRDPSAGASLRLAEVDCQGVVIGEVERPPARGVALRLDDVEGLGHPPIRPGPGVAEVVEHTHDVVVPRVWEPRLQPALLGDLAVREPAEQAPLQQILLAPLPGGGDVAIRTLRTLVLQQALEHVDRGVERSSRGTVLLFAIPAAVGHLFGQQAVHDALDLLAEVRPDRDGPSVDAGFNLALPEPEVLVVVPSGGLVDRRDGPLRLLARGVDANQVKQVQRVEGAGAAREEGAAAPSSVRVL